MESEVRIFEQLNIHLVEKIIHLAIHRPEEIEQMKLVSKLFWNIVRTNCKYMVLEKSLSDIPSIPSTIHVPIEQSMICIYWMKIVFKISSPVRNP